VWAGLAANQRRGAAERENLLSCGVCAVHFSRFPTIEKCASGPGLSERNLILKAMENSYASFPV
jgi:hypothetical protein